MDGILFKEGTKIFRVFQTLSDGDWHCGKCELPGTQPANEIAVEIRRNWVLVGWHPPSDVK
jgi:hypothetical protein